MSDVLELQEAEFDEKVLRETRPVLIDFWSPSCGPCRLLAPIFEALARANTEKAVVAKINVFENATLSAKLGVATLPTILLFKNGEIAARLSGVQKPTKLQELIDANQ